MYVRMDEDLIRRLKEKAKEDFRTIQGEVAYALEEWLKQQDAKQKEKQEN